MDREQVDNTRHWNRLWRRPFSSILHDPESAVISLKRNSYRIDLRDAFLVKEGGGDPRSLDLYLNLLTDPLVYTSMDRMTTLVYNMERKLVPGGEEDIDKRCFEFIKQELKRNVSEIRKAVDTAVLAYILGVTASEIIWYPRDGHITFDILPIDSRRLSFSLEVDEQNNVEYYQPRLKTDLNLYPGEVIPDRSTIIHRFFVAPIDSPYGLGIGQQLWWLVEFKKNAMQLWNQISDRHSMPMVIGKVPDNTDAQLVDDFFNSLEQMAVNGTFVIPDDFSVELENADTGNADILIKQLIDYCDSRIKDVILGESTSSTSLKPGLAGAARDARAITVQKAKRLADDVNTTLNNSLINWLSKKNFPNAKPPFLITDSKDDEQLAGLLNNLQILSTIGYEVDPAWIEKKTGFPQKPVVQGLGDSLGGMPGAAGGLGADGGIPEIPDVGGEEEEEPEYFDSRSASGLNPNDER